MLDQSVGLKHAELTERIIGAFYDVYNELGYGFLEQVYEQALAIALGEQGLNQNGSSTFLFGFTVNALVSIGLTCS